MVQAYWNVGRMIVEHEQKGQRRAGYGEAIIATLAEQLTRDLGRGFDERNLWHMRRFHLAFPILNALRSESPEPERRNAARSELAIQVPFAYKLVLNQWSLSSFNAKRFEDLAEHLRNEALEGLDESNMVIPAFITPSLHSSST